MTLQAGPDEVRQLQQVVADLTNHDPKREYANWLRKEKDPRADFLDKYIAALAEMNREQFPPAENLDPVWLDLLGFRWMKQLAELDDAIQFRDPVLSLLRPALLVSAEDSEDSKIDMGTTKKGGLPDLPIGFAWPTGNDCDAIYNNETKGMTGLAQFLFQLKLEDLHASHFVNMELPKSGLVSVFCYQSPDDVDAIGIRTYNFSEQAALTRTEPPEKLQEPNEPLSVKLIHLRECLVPKKIERSLPEELYFWLWKMRSELVGRNVIGHFRDGQTDDEHLLGLNRDGSTVYVNLSSDAQTATLDWVEFDGEDGI